jgi:hypothetical protein
MSIFTCSMRAAASGATGVFNQIGLISSMVSPFAAGREKKVRITVISAADRLHSGAPHSGYTQQT